MLSIINSIKKLIIFVISTVILAAITILVVDIFVAGPMNLSKSFSLLGHLSVIIGFTFIAIYGLTRTKNLLEPHVGVQVATILQYLMVAITLGISSFIILGYFGVTISTLLTSAGIISVTVGLIISTFVGGILSGALVFTTYKYKIGDNVMVNNTPGRVSDMTALVMRIRTDIGQITIPNSAIASGGVILTNVLPPEGNQETRLPYTAGDRVATSFRGEDGIIEEVTPYHTRIKLDSGKKLTFLNNSVLTGVVVVAKITT